MRRVVVTGLGMVTPLGCGVETSWSNLLAGKSGAVRVTDFPVDDLACQIACQIPRGAKADGKFDPDEWMEPKESRKVDDFIVYAMAAADQALDDAGWHPEILTRTRSRPACSSAPASAACRASRKPRSRSATRVRGASARSSFPAG